LHDALTRHCYYLWNPCSGSVRN